jgi:hypothetical protein
MYLWSGPDLEFVGPKLNYSVGPTRKFLENRKDIHTNR